MYSLSQSLQGKTGSLGLAKMLFLQQRIHRTDQTSVWYTFKRAKKSGFLLHKRKFSFDPTASNDAMSLSDLTASNDPASSDD